MPRRGIAFCPLRSQLTRHRMPSEVIVLTGATGFVGAHVAEAFTAQGAEVRALVRSTSNTARLRELGVTLFEGALDDSTAIRAATEHADAVVHMAALTRARTTAEYDAVNDAGTRGLLQILAGNEQPPRRFVYLSSLAAVGPSGDVPVPVDAAPRPLTAYGRSKLGGEVACSEYSRRFETVIVRAPAVYGPGDRELLRFFRLAALGVLPVPAGPSRPLQLIHVQDLAAALARAATLPGVGGVYHVADPAAYAWSDVVILVAEAVGRRARRVPVPEAALRGAAAISEWSAGMIGRATIFNRDKARELLAPGWLCDVQGALRDLQVEPRPLADGLKDTARWYREHGWL